MLNLALRVRSDLAGCLSSGACAFSLWSTAMLACPALCIEINPPISSCEGDSPAAVHRLMVMKWRKFLIYILCRNFPASVFFHKQFIACVPLFATFFKVEGACFSLPDVVKRIHAAQALRKTGAGGSLDEDNLGRLFWRENRAVCPSVPLM